MNLKEYLEETNIKQYALARRAKVNAGVLSKLKYGGNVQFLTALSICEASEWQIDPRDLYYEMLDYDRKDRKKKKSQHKSKATEKNPKLRVKLKGDD